VRQVSEWTATDDPTDPSADFPDAAPASDLSFSKPIPGGGWWGREQADGGPSFCWMGESRRAWIDLRSKAGSGRLRVEIPHVMDTAILEDLRIRVNGELVPHRLGESDGGVVASAELGGSLLAGPVARVQLEVDRATRPCEANPTSSDTRELSLAVSRVALLPS
jgi:hypothetical protein